MDKIIEQDCMEYLNKIDLTPLKDKTVYITGANGLIGTYFVYAVKHSQESDEIKIEVTAGKHNVWFSVSDHGTGINPEDLPKIFDMFYVAHGARVDAKRGNGLGLAICKAIVNAHGGRIIAENNKSGGATIRFSLPLEGGKGFGDNEIISLGRG
nr:ATP-binding protein [uncultured Caproiciproducens sp.]